MDRLFDFVVDALATIDPFFEVAIDSDEKDEFDSVSIESTSSGDVDDFNILWEGTIFENVQSLRHFQDSKAYVDHVLKTADLQEIESYFQWKILEHRPPKHIGMSTSKSFASLSSLSSLSAKTHYKELVNNHDTPSKKLCRTGSFCNVAALCNQYQSAMDEFMKSSVLYTSYDINQYDNMYYTTCPLSWYNDT